jgi:hypothetical protein
VTPKGQIRSVDPVSFILKAHTQCNLPKAALIRLLFQSWPNVDLSYTSRPQVQLAYFKNDVIHILEIGSQNVGFAYGFNKAFKRKYLLRLFLLYFI